MVVGFRLVTTSTTSTTWITRQTRTNSIFLSGTNRLYILDQSSRTKATTTTATAQDQLGVWNEQDEDGFGETAAEEDLRMVAWLDLAESSKIQVQMRASSCLHHNFAVDESLEGLGTIARVRHDCIVLLFLPSQSTKKES